MSSIALFLVSFIAFFVLGMPIAAAMIISSFMYALNSGMGLAIMGTKMFTGLNNFALVAIPDVYKRQPDRKTSTARF